MRVNMGEIDTKPIESVQSAISLFGEKNEQKKYRSTSCEGKEECAKEKIFEDMLKDVANYKVKLDAKEYDYKQALLKLASYRVTVDELSRQLKKSAAERDQLLECRTEARSQIDELESKVKEISYQLSEAENAREPLLRAANELMAIQEELINVKTELAAAEESNISAMSQVELMSVTINVEKEKSRELLKHVSELNEDILVSKLAAIENEKVHSKIVSEKEAEIEKTATAAVQAQWELEELRIQLDVMHKLENQLSDKTLVIDSLQSELKQVKELYNSSKKVASDSINDLNQLISELELMERKNSEQSIYIQSMEDEMKLLQSEFKNANEEVDQLHLEMETLKSEVHNAKMEVDMIRGRGSSEAQIEIAMLKAELQKGRSKIAAAEAAETRAVSVKSGDFRAVMELAIEADHAKNETRCIRHEMEKTEAEESTESFMFANRQITECMPDLYMHQDDESLAQEGVDNTDAHITMSKKEYEYLIQKAAQADLVSLSPPKVAADLFESGCLYELHSLRKELEAALAEIRDLRSVAEQAVNRAEMAEKVKLALEDQLRKWRENKKKKRDEALAALRGESTSKETNPPKYNKPAKYVTLQTTYQPLSKILNMKF